MTRVPCRASAMATCVLAAATLLLTACGRQERTIAITSQPEGAVVWLNDVELGRTPVETDFRFFGTYDVRLRLSGYEPVIASREAKAPLHEQPVIDLFATAIPGVRRTRIAWHFDLTPVPEASDPLGAEAALMDRARALRDEARADGAVSAPTPPPTPAPPPTPEATAEPSPTPAPETSPTP